MSNLLGPHKEKQTASRQFRHLGMIVLSVLVLIIAFTANIIVSAGLFSRTTRKYREEIITKTAKLAAEQIDGDKINQWLESGADDAYDNTAGLLQSICTNTPYIQYIYVYQIKPDGCHVVFDLQTLENDLLKYDEIPELTTKTIGAVFYEKLFF